MSFWNFITGKKSDQERLRYVVKGSSGDYNVTFKCSGDCDPVHEEHIPRGWKRKFSARVGDYYYVSAQSNSAESKVELKVYQNGKLFKKVEKEGDYPLATISGCVC